MISSMISEGPRDSSYEDATLAANTQSEKFARPKSTKPEYILIVEDTDISTSQKSGYVHVSDSQKSKDNLGYDLSTSQKSDSDSYISVSECDVRKNDMVSESQREQNDYIELDDIHMEDRPPQSFTHRSDGARNERPTLMVPPTVKVKKNTENNEWKFEEEVATYDKVRDVGDYVDITVPVERVDTHEDETDNNKRYFKVCTVIVIIIIVALVTAVGVLVYIVSENKDLQSSEPSSTVIFTTQNPTDPLNTSTSAIQKTTDRDETESTVNVALTTSSQKMSTPPVVTTTTPAQSTSTSSIPSTSTVKVPGYPKDCKEIRDSNITITNVYKIYPYSRSQAVNVMCEMSRDNGGWTVFQRRFDGSVDFYRVWKSYKNGFGSVTGEHWLGNDILHQLTALGESFLYVVLEDFDGKEYVAEYSGFTIADESDQYRFRISKFLGGSAKNAIEGWQANNVNGMQFSTYDRDNDQAVGSCAEARHGAWWYNECTMTNLNGRYPVDGGVCGDCNFWFRIFDNFIGLNKTMMMVRRK